MAGSTTAMDFPSSVPAMLGDDAFGSNISSKSILSDFDEKNEIMAMYASSAVAKTTAPMEMTKQIV